MIISDETPHYKPNSHPEHIKRAAEEIKSAAKSFRNTISIVDSNVTEGIYPDLREIRLNISELEAKFDIRLRRLSLTMYALCAVNVFLLLGIVSGAL